MSLRVRGGAHAFLIEYFIVHSVLGQCEAIDQLRSTGEHQDVSLSNTTRSDIQLTIVKMCCFLGLGIY